MSDKIDISSDCVGNQPQMVGEGEAIESALFKQGMRRLAAGVTLIATEVDGVRHGLVATAVTSVSADPPTLLVCVSAAAAAHAFIQRAGHFSVNVLHADSQELAKHFSNPAEKMRRFERGVWSTLSTGAPVLRDALVSFDCRIVQEARVGSHTVFFGQIVQLCLGNSAIEPLLYWNGAYHEGSGSAR